MTLADTILRATERQLAVSFGPYGGPPVRPLDVMVRIHDGHRYLEQLVVREADILDWALEGLLDRWDTEAVPLVGERTFRVIDEEES